MIFTLVEYIIIITFKEEVVNIEKLNKNNNLVRFICFRKFLNFISIYGIALFYLIIGQFIGNIFFVSILVIFKPSEVLSLFFMLIFNFIFISILLIIRVKNKWNGGLTAFGLGNSKVFKKYIKGFFIGALAITIISLLMLATGSVTINKNALQPLGISALASILVLLPAWMVQGATEEILTRGWLMDVLGRKFSKITALIGSSIFFAVLHLGNPDVNILSILNIALVGLFLGLYKMKTSDLWGVCGIHTAWNFFQGNIFGFKVSGINTQVGSIIELNPVGNYFFSGGSFGIEGSIFCMLVNSIFIVIMVYLLTGQEKKY